MDQAPPPPPAESNRTKQQVGAGFQGSLWPLRRAMHWCPLGSPSPRHTPLPHAKKKVKSIKMEHPSVSGWLKCDNEHCKEAGGGAEVGAQPWGFSKEPQLSRGDPGR